MRVCSVCEKSFEPRRKNQIYCEPSCQRKAWLKTKEGQKAKKEYVSRQKQTDPHYRRRGWLKSQYGITPEIYQELLDKQGGGCAICGRTIEQEKRHLAIDHDHTTGEIFGLLCWRCNQRLIAEVRDAELFKRASVYLTQGTGYFVPENKKKPKKRRRRRARKSA